MNKVALGQYLIFSLSLIVPKIHRVNLSVVRTWKMESQLYVKNPSRYPRIKGTQKSFKKWIEEY
jgi:hypothetical protein